MQHQSIAVTYTGKEDPFVERNYGSALTFTPGQTRELPSELAQKLLRHADVFAQASEEEALSVPVVLLEEGKDDTAGLLELAAKEKALQEEALNQRQNVVDQVNLMDKDALKEYAQNRYGQPLPKTMTVETMRSKVVGFIDQFGLT